MFSNPAALIGSLIFGAVGFVAFTYGRKMVLYKPMVVGLVLMVLPVRRCRDVGDLRHRLRPVRDALHLPRLSIFQGKL